MHIGQELVVLSASCREKKLKSAQEKLNSLV